MPERRAGVRSRGEDRVELRDDDVAVVVLGGEAPLGAQRSTLGAHAVLHAAAHHLHQQQLLPRLRKVRLVLVLALVLDLIFFSSIVFFVVFIVILVVIFVEESVNSSEVSHINARLVHQARHHAARGIEGRYYGRGGGKRCRGALGNGSARRSGCSGCGGCGGCDAHRSATGSATQLD